MINPRRLKLYMADFRTHGFTVSCKQCDYMQRNNATKPGLQHTETCRARLMTELGKSVAGQTRLENCEERITQALARHVEEADLARQVGAPVAADAPPTTDGKTDESF